MPPEFLVSEMEIRMPSQRVVLRIKEGITGVPLLLSEYNNRTVCGLALLWKKVVLF